MKVAGRIVALAGAAAVGWLLFRAAPREVTLVYDLSAARGATALHVRIQRGGEWIRSADFQLPERGAQVRQTVQLQDGAYLVQFGVELPGGALAGQRALEISESGTVVLPLGP